MAIRRSVSVVLQCQDKVVMAKRQPHLKAFPGYDAFVGGKVEEDDFCQLDSFDVAPELLGAAFRELNEELGINCQELVNHKIITAIEDQGVFTTPASFPYRFENTTLLMQLNSEIKLTPDVRELESVEWVSVEKLYQRFQKGQLLLVPAVRAVIEGLYLKKDLKDHLQQLSSLATNDFYTIDYLNDLHVLPVPSHTIPPAEHTNAFLIENVLVDPSPKDNKTKDEFLDYIKDYKITKLMLTHHHPDHRQFSNEIALALNVPMIMSEFTYEEICKELGIEFFKGIQIELIKEGDVICQWLGEDVNVIEVPGHDEGQLALMPISKRWMIVGDLIQGIGTVVIAEPEGDMQKYFQTLKKCIALDPEVIIPSHGGALGTTHYLQVTLEHRKLREKQVKAAFEESKTLEETLDLIYPDLDIRLRPLALENIKSHLKKITKEA